MNANLVFVLTADEAASKACKKAKQLALMFKTAPKASLQPT